MCSRPSDSLPRHRRRHLNIDPKNEINFDYQHAIRGTVSGQNSIPPAFGGGEVNLNLEENSFGAGFTHKF